MISEKEFQDAIAKSTVAKITDSAGNTTDLTWEDVSRTGLNGSVPATGSRPVYKTDTGWSTSLAKATGDAYVSMDKNGKFTVHAPTIAINNSSFKSQISDTLKTLSSAYKTNPDYKFSFTDEDGTTKEKSIQDVVNDLNASAQNEDGSYNPNSIKYMADAAIGMERTKYANKKINGVDLDDNDAIRINTVAAGPDLKDNTLQLISDLPEAQFLRALETYDAKTGMAQYRDIMDNAWNKEKTSSEDMEKLLAALENYFAKGDFQNKEEYIRNTATMRFLTSTQPESSWVRDVTENVRGFFDGWGSYATNLSTAANVAGEYLGYLMQGMGPELWADYQEIWGEDFGDVYIRRGGNQFDTSMPLEKVDAKIGRVTFNEYGVPTYAEESISGSFEDPKTNAQYLRAVYKENQAVIKKDLEYLHASQAAWDSVGYVTAQLATLIAAGNAMSDAFVSAGSDLILKIGAQVGGAAKDLSSFATTMYSTGTALATWDTVEGAALLTKGLGTMYDLGVVMGEAASWVNAVSSILSSSTVLTPILGVVGESLSEAIVGDPDRFVDFLKSTEVTDDTKNYMIETYVGNAFGWGVGLGLGKFLMKVGETTRGRAISANLRRKLFKVQNGIGDAFDSAILKIRRIKGDDIADQIKTLREKGGRAARQANALASAQLLRQAREAVIEAGDVKILGKDTEEIKEALAKVELKITELENMENALTSMQRRGMDIAAAWLKDDGSSLKIATSNFYKTAGKVADLERSAGKAFSKVAGAVTDMTTGKTLQLFSQTTTNYIKATEKLDFINSYIKYYENAPDVIQDVLRKIEAYKEEAANLQGMIDTFVNQATPQLKIAADRFIDADRKWWSAFEDLRSDIGLTDGNELDWFRKSGFWGENGSLYAQTGRKADLSEYVIKHRDGSSNVQTYDKYEQYMAGATGDFADPMAQMQVALYDAANKQATRSFAKSYDALTGSLTVKVSGEETVMYTRMKKGLQKAYESGSEQFLKSISEGVVQDDVVADVIKNLQTKVDTKIGQNAAKKSMRTTAEKMQKQLVAVDDSNAGRYIARLDPESTDNLWDRFYDVSPRRLMADGKQFVPKETSRYIFAKARELGVELPKGTSAADAYDAVNNALTGAARPDPSFEDAVKRSIMQRSDMITSNKEVQAILTEANQVRYTTKYETFLKDLNDQYEEFGRQYGIAVDELQVAGGQQTEAYIEAMTREGSLQREAIDETCRYYGLEGDQNAIRYFALSAYVDNEAKYKKALFSQLRDVVKKDHPKMPGNEQDKIAKILANGVTATMEEEFKDMYLIVKDINPDAVANATQKFAEEIDDAIEEIEGAAKKRKAMDEINRIGKKIEEAEADRYKGAKNIVAMRNAAGQVEYYETDKLLAGLMNFQASAQQVSGLGQAIYNANYLWTKLFRLGTTAINIKSMISQSFRDPINMFIGGGAYKTSQRVADNLTDVFGDDIVNYLKMYEPDALKALQETAEETGENVARLAVRRELEVGKALSPASTESSMYRSLRNARNARLNGAEDIYNVTAMDRVTNAIDTVSEKGGKLNEVREKTLRNMAYANGLEIAMKRGYSLDQARTYATFIMNESTTNFARMTNHLLSLRDTVPYLGSAINGSKSFWKLLSIDPVGVTGRLVGGIIIPQLALVVYSLNDEENRKIYKSIPEYQKEDNLVFVVHGQVFSIPIPQELSAFVNPFRQMVESMYDVSTNTFGELLAHDILGFSPIELDGFTDLDYSKIETTSPGFTERIGKGVMKMWSQLAPAPLKSGLEIVTGIDPYTGRKIDTSYTDIDEDGNFIVKDYKSGLLAKALNDTFKSWGIQSSAPVVQNILGNILGDASVDIADFVVSLCSAVPNGGLDWSTDTKALEANEAYNPFYTIIQRVEAPIEIEVYDEAQSAWKTAVTQLYNMKEQLLRSDEWQEYLKAKSQTTDTEKLQKLNSTKKDLVEGYFDKVKSVVENLQNNYGEQFTPAKYASVLSLMTMEEQTLDAGSYGSYLNKELYKSARAQAIQTMQELGFQSAPGQDILGRYTTDSEGNVRVETYHPLALLQLDDVKGGTLRTQSNKQHYAVIRNLISEADLYDARSDYQKQISAATKNKKYDEAKKLTNEYNEKVIRAVGAYIEQYSPESVLNGDALDYLKEYIIVPYDFQVNKYGKHMSALGNGAYLSDAYKEPYLKYIFNYGGNKL